ncbi:LacI family DNA-binding transcriptional regulator [Parvularcula maris]|uniref:LacI family DNA-binding transcriptional regulator n=1 Tax=Parvularcula maris TaxID=2965077 RepID=A0A9X2LAJ8_9PROT|nr:LacI family DNA-binding transcriptional regulator [Parvularcula maris]MCQ8186109.1 LacI family DNA-binding transcriptional regulator [Parvularcula maris]
MSEALSSAPTPRKRNDRYEEAAVQAGRTGGKALAAKGSKLRTKRAQATLKEVAELAGVSQMTVSRALNAPEMVRKPTRERIQRAVEELNYRPNLMARSLAAGRSLFIGVGYNNPSSAYLSELLLGALRTCRSAGHHLVVEELPESAVGDPEALAGKLRDSGLDGLILAPPLSENAEVAAAVSGIGIPVVLLSPGEGTSTAMRIGIDDERAALLMTRHLIGLGHRRIAFIAGPEGDFQSAERRRGFERALDEANLPTDQALIAGGAYTYRSGMDAAASILSAAAPPTAIFAANDDMAAGAVAEAHRRGLRVPEQLSVAGFDDTSLASTIWPSLTTVHQPIAEMASRAVLLLGDAGSQSDAAYQLDVEIIERESVAPPPQEV